MTEQITYHFPHEKLTPIIGKPDAKSTQLLRSEVFTNARAIKSIRGGKFGHLYTVMNQQDYTKKTGKTCTEPEPPGEETDHLFATERQLIETNRKYDRKLKEYQVNLDVKAALKKQILNTIDKKYIKALEDPEDGYADVEPMQIIDFITKKYMKITNADLEKNRDRLLEAWDPNEPIDTLWGKIDDIAKFAKQGNDPIKDSTIQHRTITMFQRQGIYQRYIDEWYDKDDDDKSMEEFKEHFKKADKHRQCNTTAKDAGYDGAAYLAKAQQDVVLAAINELKQASTEQKEGPQCVVADDAVKMYYCWSHGLGFNPRHTSKTCHTRRQGHQEKATAKNPMGGCGWIASARPPHLRDTMHPPE